MNIFLEISATIFGLIQGILVMLNKRSNWIAYIIQMLFLVLFSLNKKLYGDVINNSIYIVIGIIGLILWNKKDKNKIEKCKKKERITYICLIIILTTISYLILRKTDDPLPLLDSFTTISSLVATYYMMRKKIDTWIIWFINDIFYAVEYFILPDQAIYLFILNIIWAFMAIASYINWKKIMNQEKIKKVYFGGKFNLTKEKNQNLEKRLVNDYRSIILKSSKSLTYYQENLKINDKYEYSGPFYCEQASSGDFTSTDCNTVLNAEYKSIKNSDIFLVVFGENFSVGTVVELGWAIKMNKEIIIIYKEEPSSYQIKSEYWFAISDALKRSKNLKIYSYKNDKEITKIINKELLDKKDN